MKNDQQIELELAKLLTLLGNGDKRIEKILSEDMPDIPADSPLIDKVVKVAIVPKSPKKVGQLTTDYLKEMAKKWSKARKKRKDFYPKTVAEVLDDNIKYKPATHKAVRRFKRTHPWKCSVADLKDNFRDLSNDLAKAYKIDPPQLVFVDRFFFGSCYFPCGHMIVLTRERSGRFSVMTFLHEFGHAIRKNEDQTCRWSTNLFRKHFPRSFKKLRPDRHLLALSNKRVKEIKERDKNDKR